jgi:ABC-type sugar transport system substrate-binding protein
MKKFLAIILSLMTMLCLTSCKLITIDGEDNGGGADFAGNGSIGLSVSTQNNPFFVTLVEGANTIVVTSTDALGKKTSVTRTVTLDTKIPVFTSVNVTPNPVDAGATYVISVKVSS